MKNRISAAKDVSGKTLKKPPKGGPVPTYAAAVRRAIECYADRRGFWHRLPRRLGVYGKRWLLIGGGEGSGKTSLAAKSGLAFDFVHPGGRLTDGNEAPQWFFSDRAAYIDTDSSLNDPRQWHEFCIGLRKGKFLRRRAADGMIFVVDIRELLSMDGSAASRLASDLRDRADTLVSVSGYEIPLYFVFTKADKIDGFCELFADRSAVERMPVIGAVVGDRDSKRTAAEVFSSYYKGIYGEISELCLRRMISADRIEKSRPLCRLSSELLVAGDVITAFFAEFFKYRGRVAPRFRGFFLTSSNMGAGASPSTFSNRVLGDVIPNARFRIRESGVDTVGYWMKKICFHALMMTICAVLTYAIAGSWIGDALQMRKLESELTAIFGGEPTLENQYAALEKLRLSHDHFQGRFKSPGRLIMGTDRVSAGIRDAYIAASGRVMIAPAAKRLETMIARRSAGRLGEPAADEHLALYGLLKTYLLLTGGNRVGADDFTDVAEMFEQTLKGSFGQRTPLPDNKIVRDNIGAVIRFAADGLYEDRSDKGIVQSARERLTAAPGARTVYASIMDRLHGQRRFVPVAQIVGRNEILRYGHNISALYTRDGWEQTVLPEFMKASRDPFRADWVMGPVKARVDETKLLSELSSLYSEDLSRRWLDFIRNTHVTLPPDMPSLARDLERLSSTGESETKRMLTVVCSLATQHGQGGANAAPDVAADDNGIANAPPDPFVNSQKIFAPLGSFLAGGVFDSYLGGLSGVAEKIKNCDARGGGFTQAFVVRGEDPIKAVYDNLNKACQNMPSAVSASVKRVLESPLDFTAGALARRISVEMEENWRTEVVNYYNEKLKGRYPLDRAGSDVLWSDFEEFFKPQSGVLWKFYDRNLSGLTEKTLRGHERRSRRSMSIQLSASGEILSAYNRAERITNAFFGADGSPRRHEIVFHPFRSSNGDAQFWIGERQLNFQNGLPVTVNRTPGIVGDETITLRLITADRAQEELRFRGEWGMTRFFSAGRIEKHGADRYRVHWRVNVRNIYTANITGVVQTGSAILFDESVTRGFAVPDRVLGD